ncbi:type II toxin-antitoxin system Phd/YefM family antitoxin [Haloechinothrix alba]|nr:type II toxin-antitoxin system Phd/YefM family antitoxin [Haloechinothrix alba]
MSDTPTDPASGVVEVPVTEARNKLADLVDAVAHDDRFVYLTRRGERVAALMPADIAANYEHMEDEYWARRAAEAKDRIAAGEDEVISWDQYLAESEGTR